MLYVVHIVYNVRVYHTSSSGL